jgi:hypothetical protein
VPIDGALPVRAAVPDPGLVAVFAADDATRDHWLARMTSAQEVLDAR